MDERTKKRYNDMAINDKARHDREMLTYIPVGEDGKRKRRKRDPNAPKRALYVFSLSLSHSPRKTQNPPVILIVFYNGIFLLKNRSAFFWFCNDERPAVKLALNNTNSVALVAKELGRRWGLIRPDQKTRYEALAAKDKARYEKVKRKKLNFAWFVQSIDWLIDQLVILFTMYFNGRFIDWVGETQFSSFFFFLLLIYKWNQFWIVSCFYFQESKVYKATLPGGGPKARGGAAKSAGAAVAAASDDDEDDDEEDDEWTGKLFLHSLRGGDFLQVRNDHAALRTVPHTSLVVG